MEKNVNERGKNLAKLWDKAEQQKYVDPNGQKHAGVKNFLK
jgi:hypothetical protein